ncbi:hypothetical protein H6P81_006708 [Aristolochia fimbriata]|uniref:Uncharacterized protein n=1 Tax=Aristolochia fimbriata TaxID=158543 RepID=A0AAV7EZF4_ARIFI|nr:hypothetical protein H6P81_006708 [Aristolochia fimbriata]
MASREARSDGVELEIDEPVDQKMFYKAIMSEFQRMRMEMADMTEQIAEQSRSNSRGVEGETKGLRGASYERFNEEEVVKKVQDERAWKTIEKGWFPSTKEIGEGADKKIVEKSDTEWTKEEEKLSNCNSKPLNAIFEGVDEEQFRRISACTTAQKAWKILDVHYEGTESVRVSKLQMLTTHFELMRMREDESILEYERKIRDIANQFAALGDKISQNRLVRKILRFLSSKFKMKRVAIEEYKVIDNMTLDELIGSWKMFEMNEEAEDSAGGSKEESVALHAAWSDDESSESGEDECNFVPFAANFRQKFSSSAKSKSHSISTNNKEDTDDEDKDITVENIIQQWDRNEISPYPNLYSKLPRPYASSNYDPWRSYDAYNNTYNPSWRSHPNFSWSNNNQHPIIQQPNAQTRSPPGFQRAAPEQEQKASLEDLLSKILANQENGKARFQIQEASIRNLEIQLGQLANVISEHIEEDTTERDESCFQKLQEGEDEKIMEEKEEDEK